MYKSFLIKYAEIAIKGKNRYLFEDALVSQINHALKKADGEFLVRKEQGRIYVDALSDYDYDEAVDAFEYLSRTEGIIPAVESAHAVAYAMKLAPTMRKDQIIIICLSGRGDKDVASIAKYRGVNIDE